MSANLRSVDEHFAFGENWQEYSKLIDDTRIASAKEGLLKLVGEEQVKGSTFLDIGSGSGLHSCAAGLLGASRVTAVDVDRKSVETTGAVLSRFLAPEAYEVHERSVFDLSPDTAGKFDIVCSWGVLHHTGDQDAAIRAAASLVNDDGLLVLALYRRHTSTGSGRLRSAGTNRPRRKARSGRNGPSILPSASPVS